MPEDKISFSEEAPKGGKLYGAFQAISVAAGVTDSQKDRSDKMYHKIWIDFQFNPGGEREELPTKRAFCMLPYDYWKDGKNGPISPFRQLCDVLKKSLSDFNEKPVSEAFVGLEATILIGAQKHWKTGEIQMWGENKDKINYGILGFAPYAKGEKAWTAEMENAEQAAINGVGKASPDGGMVEEESAPQNEVATPVDVEKTFEEEKPASGAKKAW